MDWNYILIILYYPTSCGLCYLSVQQTLLKLVKLILNQHYQNMALTQSLVNILNSRRKWFLYHHYPSFTLPKTLGHLSQPIQSLIVRIKQYGLLIQVINRLYYLGVARILNRKILKIQYFMRHFILLTHCLRVTRCILFNNWVLYIILDFEVMIVWHW